MFKDDFQGVLSQYEAALAPSFDPADIDPVYVPCASAAVRLWPLFAHEDRGGLCYSDGVAPRTAPLHLALAFTAINSIPMTLNR